MSAVLDASAFIAMIKRAKGFAKICSRYRRYAGEQIERR